MLDPTTDIRLKSHVASAEGHVEFPIQNLPFGVFSPPDGSGPRGGVAIGDEIFDIGKAVMLGLFADNVLPAAKAASGAVLNPLMAMGASARRKLREAISALLSSDVAADTRTKVARALWSSKDCQLHVPAQIGDYTDFFCGINHAANGGKWRNPDKPEAWLSPNYHSLPVGYHGRASSIVISGTDIRRPNGQFPPQPGQQPIFGPSRKLDYEFEFATWVGTGNQMGDPIAIADAPQHIFGHCLMNDWSARDVQFWEMQPLGPFLSKSLGTTVSPWIVTPEALAPFRAPLQARWKDAPATLPYLTDEDDQKAGSLDIELEAFILTAQMRAKGQPASKVSRANATDLYWTFAQMIAHHTCGGCNLRPGDLLGSGTISAVERSGFGSMNELASYGSAPIELNNGETRAYLQDGDEVIFTAHCRRDGFATIGFGECRGTVLPAVAYPLGSARTSARSAA